MLPFVRPIAVMMAACLAPFALIGCGAAPAVSATISPSRAPTATPTPPCPGDAELLAAAKAGNHGSLPADTSIRDKQCVRGYVVATLVTTATDPAQALFKVDAGQVTLVVLGTADLCQSPGVRVAPPEVRAAMKC